MNRACLAVVGVAFVTPLAFGQSINIDFGLGLGVPDDSYAGKGAAGRWNAVDLVPMDPVPLLGLDGADTSALLMAGPGSESLASDDPGTFGADEQLMDDFLAGSFDSVRFIRFSGLEPGLYRVVTYGWTPSDPNELTSVWVETQAGPTETCGGVWPGKLVQGVTHVVHHANVVNGELVMSVVGGIWGASGNINGMQLVRVGDVCLSDWNHDGVSNSQDFFDFLAAFFEGFADFNENGVTDSQDFFDFLTSFFEGCG